MPPPSSFALAVKAQVGEPVDAQAITQPAVDRVRPTKQRTESDEAILREARERWNRCDEAENKQRERILTAKQFRAGDQWPSAIRLARNGSQAIQGQPAQPLRPCLTIDRLSQPCRQVSNQIKNADFGFDVLPNGFGADDETARLFEGYLRRVQIQARGESPIEWAADGAVEGGLGWFRIRTEYVNETWDGDPDDPEAYDQELRLERIVNNLTVYCDPSALKPTRSDALFMFVTEDMSRDEFERRWPDADLASLDDFAATGDLKGWVDKDNIRIAEYWRIRYQDVELHSTSGLTRTVRKPIVDGFKISAVQVLERWAWLGSRIPLIPVLGEELNVDGKAVLRGVIEEGMDAQRMVNYTYSGGVEIFALGNKSPYVVAEEQLGDYQQIWQTANTYNWSYLPYKATPNAPPPKRDTSEAPIQAAVALMQVSEEAIKATTGIYDPTLGNIDPRAHSGRAIQALQGQSDISTSNYSDNVVRALVYAGELMMEIAPKLTRVGQLMHIIGDDDLPEQVMIGRPFQQQNGRAVPAPPHITPEQAKLSKGLYKFFDMKAGRYAVTVTAGKATATKREEGAAALKDLIPHLPPEMAMVVLPDFVRQLSFDGSEKIATKLEKALPPGLQAQEEGDGPDPKVQQLTQMVQQLQQQLQSKVAEKQAEAQAKGQIDLQKTSLQEQAESQRTAAEIQGGITKAEIAASASMANAQAKVDAENFRSYVDALEGRLAKALDLHMQKLSEALTRQHEHVQNAMDRAHDVGMAHVEHQHALEQAQTAAALAPAPVEGDANA